MLTPNLNEEKIYMSIWLSIALISYCLGAVIQWLQLKQKFQEFDEYTNFPIIWVAKMLSLFGCFIEALMWPYSLILNDEY
jgi:hypothetical protein